MGILYGSYSWGHPVLWMTLQIMLVVAGIVLVILMVRNGRIGNTGHRQDSPTARQILDERYAKGELDKETYEQMKKDIQ